MATSKFDVYMNMALEISKLATCTRRKVGCLLLDENFNVLATGCNRTVRDESCIKTPCKGAHCASGEGLEVCSAVHAEQDALMKCADVQAIKYCVSTTFPCLHCMKMLMLTSCQLIVFKEDYPHLEAAKELWCAKTRRIMKL